MNQMEPLSLNICLSGGGLVNVEGLTHTKTLPFLSIAQSQTGSYEISINDGPLCATGEGGCFIAPADVKQTIVHHLPAGGEPMKIRWMFLSITDSKLASIDQYLSFPLIVSPEAAANIGKLIDEFEKVADFASLGANVSKHRIGFSLFEELLKLSGNAEVNLPPELHAVFDYMEQKIRTTVSNRELACLTGLSESRFCHYFKEKTGQSPNRYFLQKKLKAAGSLLTTSRDSIAEISAVLGFYDQFHFSRLFKAQYGISPLKYRKYFGNQVL